MAEKTMIVITGPTASGKSALAVEVARRLGCEIISADSRQIFRGIPIATAVPTMEERGGVPHHLVEELDLGEYFSAAEFERRALDLAGELFARSDYVVVCGGSVMYVDALCNGIDELPTVPDDVRQSTAQEAALHGAAHMLAELERLDPAYYARVDRSNLKRVIHAVEICRTAGRPYSEMLTGRKRERPFRILKFALCRPRAELFDRINKRVDAMIEAGLEGEARKVYPLRHLNSLNTVGLKEMFAYFAGLMDRPTAIARIAKNSRVYAKKQLTWLSRDATLEWIDIAHPEGAVSIICERLNEEKSSVKN